MSTVLWLAAMVAGTAAIVWGAERFAEHLADASKRLGVTASALAVLLAGAEPEELATVVTASARGSSAARARALSAVRFHSRKRAPGKPAE